MQCLHNKFYVCCSHVWHVTALDHIWLTLNIMMKSGMSANEEEKQ